MWAKETAAEVSALGCTLGLGFAPEAELCHAASPAHVDTQPSAVHTDLHSLKVLLHSHSDARTWPLFVT